MGPNRYGPGVVNAMTMPAMRQPLLRHQMYSPVQQIQGSEFLNHLWITLIFCYRSNNVDAPYAGKLILIMFIITI